MSAALADRGEQAGQEVQPAEAAIVAEAEMPGLPALSAMLEMKVQLARLVRMETYGALKDGKPVSL